MAGAGASRLPVPSARSRGAARAGQALPRGQPRISRTNLGPPPRDFADQPAPGLCPLVALGVPVPCGMGTWAHGDRALGDFGGWEVALQPQRAGWEGVGTRELSLAGLSTQGR